MTTKQSDRTTHMNILAKATPAPNSAAPTKGGYHLDCVHILAASARSFSRSSCMVSIWARNFSRSSCSFARSSAFFQLSSISRVISARIFSMSSWARVLSCWAVAFMGGGWVNGAVAGYGGTGLPAVEVPSSAGREGKPPIGEWEVGK